MTRIVLFGATGYTGRLAAESMVERGLRPVLAARGRDALEQMAAGLGGLDTAVADVSEPPSVRALVERGDVLVTTVGAVADPSFAYRDGRVQTERGAKRVRSFELGSKQRDAISVGSSEHFALPKVAPQLQEWSAFFAANAGKRAAADAGIPVVTQREADDLLRDAEAFLALVAGLIGAQVQGQIHEELAR